VIPSATTTSVWNRPHRSRSSRAGISVVMIAPLGADACPGSGTIDVISASWGLRQSSQVRATIDAMFGAGLADPKFRAQLANLGVTPFALSPIDFGKFIADEPRSGAR
jgi:hypothetical protein